MLNRVFRRRSKKTSKLCSWPFRWEFTSVIMGAMASQIISLTIVYSPFIQAQIKENLKAPRHWPLWGEFTGHRWIPYTKGQWRGKCFHFMTSSRYHQYSFFFSRLRFTGEWVGDQQERGQHYGKRCRRCHLRWLDLLAFWIRTQFWYRTRMEQCLLWLGSFPDHYK